LHDAKGTTMLRRLLPFWASLLVAGAGHADTTFSYSVSGDQQVLSGMAVTLTFTPGANDEDVAVPPTGTDILAGFYTSQTVPFQPDSVEGTWVGRIRITDAASGESVEAAIGGKMQMAPYSPNVELDPATFIVGPNRYILTNGPWQDEGPMGHPFMIHVMVQSLDAPRLEFTTQPGSAPAEQPLRPQPVVMVLNPDGSVAADYAGAVALSIRPGSGTPTATLLGTTQVPTVNGVAAFTDIAVSERAQGYILTAISTGASGTDSAPFDGTMKLGADPVITVRTTGRDFHSYSPPPIYNGRVAVETGYSTNTIATAAGKSLLTIARFEFEEGGASRYVFGGVWRVGLEVTDETSGEKAATLIAGPFTMQGCCTYPQPPLTTNLFPRTVVAGGRRYTFTGQGTSGNPNNYGTLYLTGIVTYNPPEQPGLSFATQPGGQPEGLTLDPQPVVVMRKPDGTTDTSFTGPVTLIVTPGTARNLTLSTTNFGRITVNAVYGIATVILERGTSEESRPGSAPTSRFFARASLKNDVGGWSRSSGGHRRAGRRGSCRARRPSCACGRGGR
jgi:hypothetical protein